MECSCLGDGKEQNSGQTAKLILSLPSHSQFCSVMKLKIFTPHHFLDQGFKHHQVGASSVETHVMFNRPGIAGAVLQTAPLLIR